MARLPTKLECPAAEVDPGGRLACRLLVYNAADRVDEVSVATQGPLASWVTVTPATLALLPETEGSFEVVLDLGGDPPVAAGTHPLLLEATSGLAGTEPSLEELDVEVARRTESSLSLVAQDTVEALVENRSNHPLRLHLDVEAPVGVDIDPPVLEVAPFSSAAAVLTPHAEPGRHAPVEVTVRASGDGTALTGRTLWTPGAPPPEEERAPATPVRPDEPEATRPVAAVATGRPRPEPRGRRVAAVALLVLAALAGIVVWNVLDDDRPDGVVVRPPPAFELSAFPVLQFRQPRPDARPWEQTWQLMLQRRGYELGSAGADGRFGPLTEAATEQFQQDEGLPATGVVGAEEWAAMLIHYWEREDPAALDGWQPEAADQVRQAWPP